jgi:signal transduction histidine kinase
MHFPAPHEVSATSDTASWLPQSGTSLRWAVGLYCTFIGSFVLVSPHQFSTPTYEALSAYRALWAMATLAAGVSLVTVAALRTRREVRIAVHSLAAVVLLALALGLALSGGWSSAIAFATLGAGMLAPAAMRGRPPRGQSGDLLALLMGGVASLTGAGLLAFPNASHPAALSTGVRPYIGLALLVTGLPLMYVQLRPVPRRALWLGHLGAGAALLSLGALRAVPPIPWNVIALDWGIGGGIALLPGLRSWSAGFDTSALRTRLAMALAAVTCLTLVFAVAVSSTQQERLATAQALETLRVEARSVAQNVRDYVELNGARATAIAALAGRLPLDSATLQRDLLVRSRPAYGDTTGLLLVGLDGRLIASDGGASLGDGTLRATAGAVRAEAIPVQLAIDSVTRQPLLLVAAPVVAADGRLLAGIIMAFTSGALERRIAREGSIVSLNNGHGVGIARSDDVRPLDSLLTAGWDREVLAGARPTLNSRLAEYARVPDLGWVVALEQPRAAALAGVDRGRDLAFALLLAVLPLAVAGGILAARRITRPLGMLADAVDELTAGNPWAPLERSAISEVERLSAAFRGMRDRLALRTAESERLATELRARAEALAETDRRKDEFLAMLAHELRNPLGAISTAAYILGQLRAVEPPVVRSAAVIQRQTQHLVRLVDDLLDMSRITRGKVELRRIPLDMGDVMRQALETTRPLAEARQHQLVVSLPVEPLPVIADPTRLEQVFANLIRNAVKFTEPGGRIEVDVERRGEQALVRIRDTGVGIAKDLLPRVFDLFTQGQQGLDRSSGGLGIGLTLVRSLVEMHGGRVTVHSEGPGQGSEFVILLPLTEPSDLAVDEARETG